MKPTGTDLWALWAMRVTTGGLVLYATHSFLEAFIPGASNHMLSELVNLFPGIWP